MKISARNQFQGKVASLTPGPVNVTACPPDCVI
jgi:molybdopterin-binding protein